MLRRMQSTGCGRWQQEEEEEEEEAWKTFFIFFDGAEIYGQYEIGGQSQKLQSETSFVLWEKASEG